ncbi:MAG: hypothetical protein KAT86_02300, partial [Candidatus Latescibacteria bacterium]|nr:hypothetical protein [Candidatus Latescibacterota bacterium]
KGFGLEFQGVFSCTKVNSSFSFVTRRHLDLKSFRQAAAIAVVWSIERLSNGFHRVRGGKKNLTVP